MTPATAIAMLDRQIAAHGEDVILRKTNSATGQVTVRAKVRDYEPQEFVGLVKQGDNEVIVSPTGLESFGLPVVNGYVVIAGAAKRVEGPPNVIRVAGTVVRIEMQVRG